LRLCAFASFALPFFPPQAPMPQAFLSEAFQAEGIPSRRHHFPPKNTHKFFFLKIIINMVLVF
jgi:hypothetical protein